MSADQSTSELTTRDVLVQVDRRVTLIEGDVRELREHMDARFDAAGRETSRQFSDSRRDTAVLLAEARRDFAERLAETASRLDARLDRLNVRLQWGLGLLLASWVTTLGAVVGVSLLR